MQHSPEVSQPSSLSQTHLSVVLRWLAYVPDSFSRPSLQWRHTLTPAMLTPRPKKERVSCASHRSLSWCRLTRSRQSSVFLRRYVKHQGWSVRVYLLPVWGLHGNPLWRRHLLSVSRSQHESIRGRKGDGDVEERHTVFPLYSSSTVLLQETCVHFHKYWLLSSGGAVLAYAMKRWPLHLIQIIKFFLIFAFTENHPGLEHQINASCLALCFAL